MAKAAPWTKTDAQVRKRGEQTGLDTLVVHAVKGIDGGPHKRWSMWFNSMQREEPYLVLTSTEVFRDENVPSGTVRQVLHGCRQLVL